MQRRDRLLVLAAAVLVVAAWAFRISHDIVWISTDGLVRFVMARGIVAGDYILTPDTFWLPLPLFWQAAFMKSIPFGGPALQAVSSLVAIILALLIVGIPSKSRADTWDWGPAGSCLLLTIPMVFGFTTSFLAEPLCLLLLCAALRLFFALLEEFSLGRAALLLVVLAGLELSRYESWISSIALWAVLFILLLRRKQGNVLPIGIGGMVLLLLLPLGWLAVNHYAQGSWHHPFELAEERALALSVADRLMLAFRSIAGGAMILLPLAIWGFLKVERKRRYVMALPLLCLSLPYLYMMLSNQVGCVYPERFALPILVALLPFGIAGYEAIGKALSRRRLDVWWCVPVAGAVLAILLSSFDPPPTHDREAHRRAKRIAEELRKGEAAMIYDFGDSAEAEYDLQFFRACNEPKITLMAGEWFGDRLRKEPDLREHLNFRVVLFRKEESLDLSGLDRNACRFVPLHNGWRLATEDWALAEALLGE
ncbi:hypothetical protein KQI84_02685 [bacterium]|nr:hypothetical protein [bacterium]